MANWSTAFWDGTYESKTSNVGAGVNVYYVKKFLDFVLQNLFLVQAGQVQPLPEGNGDTVEWFRWLRLGESTPAGLLDSTVSGAARLAEGLLPNATAIKGQKLRAQIAEYGAFGQLTTLLKKTHIDPQCEGAVDLFAEQAATIMDTLAEMIVGSHLTPLRSDFESAGDMTFRGTV